MSLLAPPIARRLAMLAALVGAVGLFLSAVLVQDAGPAAASPAVPSASDPATPTPSPAPSSKAPAAAPRAAQVSLERADCDTARLVARTDAGVTLAYRVADESGQVAASGTFVGSADLTIPLSTGHDYTASVADPASGAPLASSAPASLRDACTVSVAPDAPGFVDPCGAERDVVQVPRVIGVDYRAGGTVLAPGANVATGTVTVVAVARPGYALVGPAQWTHTFTVDPCLAAPEPPAPAQAAAPHDQGPAIPSPPGIQSEQSVPPNATAAAPSAAGPPREDPAVRADTQPAVQASVGAPGPLAWGIMIALALTGGVVFWLKTRH